MMVRKLSLIVSVLFAVVAVNAASAQPSQAVGPWSTLEQVSGTLQDRQERKEEVVGRIEEERPEFFARNAERLDLNSPLLLSPSRLGAWSDGSVTAQLFGPSIQPVSTAVPTATSVPVSPPVVPYQPLVLGAFFGFASNEPAPSYAPAPAPVTAPLPTAPAVHLYIPAAIPLPASPPPAPAPPPAPVVTSAAATPPRPIRINDSVISPPADAYLNFSDGPFPASQSLTVGTPVSWLNSPVITEVFGRTPSEQEQKGLEAAVLAKVERAFRSSGVDVDLTTDPGSASHTLSVVSGALAKDNPAAIGIADIGGDGFTFIDNFNSPAIDSVDDLETALAKNISHELMHAFGVDYHDETGEHVDSGTIRWDLLTNNDLSFSEEAVNLLSSADFQKRWDDLLLSGQQQIDPLGTDGAHATPEPATLAMWAMTVSGLVWSGRRYGRGNRS